MWVGFSASISGERDAVVAEYAQLFSHLAQILDKVVREGIVVIDDDNHSSNPPQRQINGPDQRPRLVHRFHVFVFGNRIGDDSSTRLNVALVPTRNQRPDRNARIQIVAEVHIHDGAGIDSAPRRFQLVDDFHRADFWRSGNGAGGEAGHQRIQAGPRFP